VRPDLFETWAVGLLAAHPAVEAAAALRDAGDTRHPYGMAIRLAAGQQFRWQITATSGETYEPAQCAVDPKPPVPASPYSLEDADALLAYVLTAAGSPDLGSVLAREGGLTIRCADGVTLYLRALLPHPTGRRAA
jgi:hypothetical protein